MSGISIGCSGSNGIGLSSAGSGSSTSKGSLMGDILGGRELGHEVGLDLGVVIDVLSIADDNGIVCNGFIPCSKGIGIAKVVVVETVDISFRKVKDHGEEEES